MTINATAAGIMRFSSATGAGATTARLRGSRGTIPQRSAAVLDECDVGTGGPYSFLRASIGSILDALIAGRYVAMTTTAVIIAITRTKVRPSVAETPNSRLRRKRPSRAAPANPIAVPARHSL